MQAENRRLQTEQEGREIEMPVVFINCKVYPFINLILSLAKAYETRNRNTLKSLIGKRIWLCETGNGRKIVKGSAMIESVLIVEDKKTYNSFRKQTRIRKGSVYDWKQDTKRKYLYRLTDIKCCKPFEPEEGKRHGFTWMESNMFD